MKEYEHDIEKEGQIEVDLQDDDGRKIGRAVVGVGNPAGRVIDDGESKYVDDKGDPIVAGRAWSQADTGVFLCVGVSNGPVMNTKGRIFYGTQVGLSRFPGAHSHRLFVATSDGLPAWNRAVIGAALEIPSDLGQDSIKRQYVAEWLAHTAVESLQAAGIGFDMNHKELGGLYKKLAIEISDSADDAIRHTGM